MAVIVKITSSSDITDGILMFLEAYHDKITLEVQRGVSVSPPGDVINLLIPNRAQNGLLHHLEQEFQIGQDPNVSVVISRPDAIIAKDWGEVLANDNSEASLEEMELSIGRDSNMNSHTLILMFMSAVLATIGLITDALHLVMAAMVVIPGFEPILRIGLGIVVGGRTAYRGVVHTVQGYTVFIAGAAITTAVFGALGHDPRAGDTAYFFADVLIPYWSKLSPTSIAVAVAASVTGALVVITNRTVLTIGVMIALSLVPASSMLGMAIARVNGEMFVTSAMRLLTEIVLIVTISAAIFYIKKRLSYRRNNSL